MYLVIDIEKNRTNDYSMRVSNELGAGNPNQAKSAMAVAIKLYVLLAVTVVLALGFGHNIWAGFFSKLGRKLGTNLKNFFGSLPTTTFSRSSHFTSLIDPLSGNTRVFDCYKPLLAEVEDSILGRCKMTATMHCLAIN